MPSFSRDRHPRSYLRFLLRLLGRLALVLALYMVLRLLFFGFNRYLMGPVSGAELVRMCVGGLRFDLAALFYTNAAVMALSLLPFPFVFRRGWQALVRGLFVGINALAFAVNLADFAYFRFTQKRTDFSFFKEFGSDLALGTIIKDSLVLYWPLFLYFGAVTFLLWWGSGRSLLFRFRRPWRAAAANFLTLVLLGGLGLVAVRGGIDRTTRPITLSNAGAYVSRPVQAGVVLNTPFCLIRTLGSQGLAKLDYYATEAELEAVYTPLHPGFAAPRLTLPPEDRPLNVIILILESFSREYVGAMNPPSLPGFTPFLDSLAAHSHACHRAFANGRKSIDAMPSILGSIPSFEKPFIVTPYALNDLEGLGTLLGARGYHTSFFHGAPNGSMGFDAMAALLGFDHYYGKDEFANDSEYDGVWGIWDEPFLQYFAQELSRLPQPFATALFTVSSHHPFQVPEQYKGVFPQGTVPLHPCIGYTDHALRRFFATARSQPWFAHSLFVITADHGAYSQVSPAYQNPAGSMAIPILYYAPGRIAPCRDTSLTQQIDILPTVLDYLGYDRPFVAFGRSLADSLSRPFAFNYPNAYLLQREAPEAENRAFEQAFLQQYQNRLIENRLTAPK